MDKGTKGQISILFFPLSRALYNNLPVLTFSLCSLKSLFVSVYFDVEENNVFLIQLFRFGVSICPLYSLIN